MSPYTGTTSAWRTWYRAVHKERFGTLTGNAFEEYVTDALAIVHGPTFVNPRPKGQLGDHGCDGITGDGSIAYACYGYLPNRASEQGLADKVEGDFARAKKMWDTFATWRFVSNVGFGPLAAKALVGINRAHSNGSDRQIEASTLDESSFWNLLLLPLPPSELDKIFPGVPHASNVTLAELYPLLDELGNGALSPPSSAYVGEISPQKMNYNRLSQRVRIEFQDARVHVPAIQEWFAGHLDPTLRDSQGARFRQIYTEALESTSNPNEVVERLYVSLGGDDFRYDDKRANAVYAVTAYFFDECDIFEVPPAGWVAEE